MKKLFTSLHFRKCSYYLFILLFLTPYVIHATHFYSETCVFSSNLNSENFQIEDTPSNWFQFTATSNFTVLKLSEQNTPYHLFIIYTDDEVITKGAIFEEGRHFQLATIPRKTYYILQIDDETNTSILHLQVEPGEIQRLEKKEKGNSKIIEINPIIDEENSELGRSVLNGPDCDQATTLCNSTSIAYNPTDSGANDFTGGNSDGCLGGEHLSAWYYFEFNASTPAGSSIEFTINPDGGDDYDFAVWGPGVDCENLGGPIRCSYSSAGLTGLMNGSGDTSEGPAGNGFVEDIEVNAGDGFYLLIDNFSTSFSGFTLNWGGDAAPFLDCSAVPPEAECSMTANATTNSDTDICSGQIVVVNGTSNNGSGQLIYSWLATPASAQGYIESPNDQFSIISFPNDAVGEFTFTFSTTQVSDGCVATSNVVFNVEAGEPPVLQSFEDVCDTDDPISLDQFQSGIFGNWSGENVGGNNFDPDGLSGTIPLIFTPNPGQCAAVDTAYINVGSSVPISLDAIPEMCQNAESFDLPTTQSGLSGNWSGDGVTDNMFNPDGLSGSVELTFSPTLSCGEPATTTVIITEAVEPNLDEFPPMCVEDAALLLPTTQDDIEGTWSIDGSEETEFDPQLYGGEDVELTFVPNPDQCATEANTSITVNLAEEPFLEFFDPICDGDDPINLSEDQNGVIGNWSGDGVTDNIFDPDGQTDEVTLTFTPEEGQCAAEATTNIFVTNGAAPELEDFDPMCDGDDAISLNTTQDGVEGSWSGDGVTDNMFNPDGQSDNVTLTFTPDEGQCSVEAMTMIMVTTGEAPELGDFDPMCDGDDAISLNTTQDGVEGSWSGDGVTDNMFNPDGQSDNVTLTFTPNEGQCAAEAMTMIMVTMRETPELPSFDDLCQSDDAIELATFQDGINGTWSGDGVTDNMFNPDGQSDNVTLIFTPDDGQCASEVTTTIMVEVQVIPNLETFMPLCESDAPISLAATQDGVDGTWSGDGVFDNEFTPTGQDGTIILTFTPEASACAAANTTSIEVGLEPEAELSANSLSTCNSEAEGSIVNLAELVVSGNQNGTWTDTDGAGVDLSDAAVINFDGVSAPATYVFTYTVSSATGTCPEQSYTVDVFVQDCTCPSVATNSPPNLCNSDAVLDLSTLEETEEEGTWMIVSSPAGTNSATLTGDIFDATQRDAGTYEVAYVLDTAPLQGCPPSSNQMIVVENAAAPALNMLNPMCDLDAALSLPTVQDGLSGAWSGDGVDSDNMFNPSGLTGMVVLTFTPDADLCASPAMTEIMVNTATPPSLDELGTVCESGDPVALATMQNGVMGNWEGTGVSANQFNPSTLDGDIELTFVPEAGSCALSNVATITVTGVFVPDLETLPNFCQADSIYSLSMMQDGIAGEWSGDGVENMNAFNPANLEGEITLTFTPTSSDCANTNTTTTNVTAIVTPTLDDLGAICTDATAMALPSQQDGISGTWTGDGVSITGDEFDPNGLTGAVTLTFMPEAGACAAENTTTIQVDDTPFAMLSTNTLMTCSTASEGSIVDLAALVVDGDTNGTWADTDGTGVDVSDASRVDFENIPDGTYTFTYTTNGNVTCPDPSYMVSISVSDCLIDCPDVSTNPPTAPLCNMDGSLDLSTLVNTEESGTWAITNSPSANNSAVITGTIFDATEADAGIYEVTYTIVNTVDQCAETSSQMITVEAQPFAVLSSNSTNTCNASADGSLVNLSSFIVDGDSNGTWTDDSGAGVNLDDFTEVDFDGVTPDATYSFTYTTTNATASCPAPTYTLDVFVENCACPSVALSTPDPICNSDGLIDLNSLQITNQVGTWSVVTGPNGGSQIALDGTMLDATGVDAGDYELQFTLDEAPQAPCPAFNTITISVDAAVDAGTANAALMICNSENTSISLANEITGADAGGQWVETSAIPSQGSAFSINNATFNPNGQTAGTYSFTYQIGDPNSVCPTDETTVDIVVAPTPIADAGLNQQLTCNNNTVTLNGGNSTGDRFEWTDTNGNMIGTAATIVVETAGDYTLTAISDAGCMSTDAVTVEAAPGAVVLDVEPISPGCEETTGSIIVADASGGTMPYTFGLNGETISGLSDLSNLEPGDYTVQLIDVIGCLVEETVTIPEPQTLEVDLVVDDQSLTFIDEDNVNIPWGDSTRVTLVPSVVLGQNAIIEWSNPELLSCPDTCFTTLVTPVETTTISVNVIDETGCNASAELTLFVDKRPQIYPPTGFTPDDDSYNDYFMIFTGPAVRTFDSFLVFNRWGENVFGNFELALNEEMEGWDGTFKGEKMNPEVFVWVAEFTLIDGTKVMRKGEVTIVR